MLKWKVLVERAGKGSGSESVPVSHTETEWTAQTAHGTAFTFLPTVLWGRLCWPAFRAEGKWHRSNKLRGYRSLRMLQWQKDPRAMHASNIRTPATHRGVWWYESEGTVCLLIQCHQAHFKTPPPVKYTFSILDHILYNNLIYSMIDTNGGNEDYYHFKCLNVP